MKQYTVAILGVGSRGGFVYGRQMSSFPDRYKVVSLCDIRQGALDLFGKEFDVKEDQRFLDEKEFFKEKRADVLVIATQDRDHVRQALVALKLGYDILLEKPISPDKKELLDLLALQQKTGRKILVAHVLRYAPAYLQMKKWLDEGSIGEVIKIESIERVAYWHQSHSFVRGNWHSKEETSPMIMAKCCHDLDILQWLANSKCDTIYSTGSLKFFKKANQPKGASNFCKDCKFKLTCPYSAELQYCTRFLEQDKKQGWPFNVVIPNKLPFTVEDLRAAYESNQYGRCVFDCDNDVVDNQQVEMIFENGITVSHTMTAFTAQSGRRIDIHGTYGEILFDEAEGFIRLYKYDGLSNLHPEVFDIMKLVEKYEKNGFGHGGGDYMMVQKFYDILEGKAEPDTALEKSIESHLMAIAAEESRITKKIVKVH